MADEIPLRQSMERAAQARALLDDMLLNEAFAELRRAYIDAWFGTSASETDTRERLWVATTVLTKVRGHLEQAIANGKIAAAQIADLEEKARRKRA